MKILLVAGSCLQINSSANLCHLSYINGLLDAGHIVDLLTVSPKNLNIDNSMSIPKVRNIYEFEASKYEQLGAAKKSEVIKTAEKKQSDNSKRASVPHLLLSKLKNSIKKVFRNMYGVHGMEIMWYLKACKFKSDEKYDYVISLAYPPVSHLLAEKLIKRKKIVADKFIQIWEDPWYADIYGLNHTEKVRKEEERLLKSADRVCYVSPLTLMYQKEAFPKSQDKMYWQPLPSYYRGEDVELDFSELFFGYFGDYTSQVRNLRPFYNVAVKHNLKTNICGSSDCGFTSDGNVAVYPRMPLSKLKKYEDEANVLVFVCNLKGGQIPGKIYQYSATSKMILFILDGTEEEQKIIREYFEKFERYVFCQNTEESIAEAIDKLKALSVDSRYSRPMEDFSPKQIISNILEG